MRHLAKAGVKPKKNGKLALFNVNDFPFPYKVVVHCTEADDSSIEAIKRVGGEVVIVKHESREAYGFCYLLYLLVTSLFATSIFITFLHLPKLSSILRCRLKAHLAPEKFPVLPATLTKLPSPGQMKEQERDRQRGATVSYPKPLWFLREEQRIRDDWKRKLAGKKPREPREAKQIAA